MKDNEVEFERIRAEQAESHRDWLVSVLDDIIDVLTKPPSYYATFKESEERLNQQKIDNVYQIALKSKQTIEDMKRE